MATMKDIAREAGVSHGTVSNVLNKTGKVSIEKIRLVEEAAKRLGYVSNSQAQLLRQGSATTIALVIPSLREDTYLDLYTTLQSSLKPAGYDVSVYTTDDLCEYELSVLKQLPLSNILAIVSVSALKDNMFGENPYHAVPCPVIFVERCPNVLRPIDSYVAFDNHAIAEDLISCINCGHYSKIAFFSAPGAIFSAKDLFNYMDRILPKDTVTLERFSSDMNLSLAKAFDILCSDTEFELIITAGTVRADAVLNAITLSNCKKAPKLIALGALTRIPSGNFLVYELDYSKAGIQISEMILQNRFSNQQEPARYRLQPKGFPFRFPNVKRMDGETVSLLTLDTPSTNALKKLTPMFKTASGIQLKIVSMPYNDLHQQIPMLNEFHHYDMIRMDIAMIDSLGENTYVPLAADSMDTILSQNLVHNSYDKALVLNRTSYALPFDPSTQIFLYRRDLFEDATISRAFYERYHEKLTVPATIGQYLKVAEFFTQKYNPMSPTRYGATMTCGSASAAASDFMPYLLARRSSESKSGFFSTKENIIAAMEQYVQMTSYATKQSWWQDSMTQFINGEAATTVIYSNYAPYVIDSKHSSVAGKIGAAVVPGGHPLIGGGVIGICKYSRKVEACIQFLNWYYSGDISSLLVKLGGTSPLAGSYSEFKNISIFPWLTTAKKNFELGTRGLGKKKDLSVYQFEFTVGTAVRNVLTETMSIEEAAQYIQSAI